MSGGAVPESAGDIAQESIELLLRKMAPDYVKKSPKFQQYKAAVDEAPREGESSTERNRRLKHLWEELYGELR